MVEKPRERENEKNLQGGQYLLFSQTDRKTAKSSFFLNGFIVVLWFVVTEH